MKKLSLIITAILVLGTTSFVKGQNPSGGDTDHATHNVTVNIPLFALVDVEDDGADITLTPSVSNEAGAPLDFTTATDNSSYLNYTSVVGSNSGNTGADYYGNGNANGNVTSRKITAKISSDLDNTGVAIKVTASSYSGNGAGTMGTAGSPVILSSSEQELITGIGSCYTGNGTENGHNLTYSLVQTEDSQNNADYAALIAGSYNVTITYTITE